MRPLINEEAGRARVSGSAQQYGLADIPVHLGSNKSLNRSASIRLAGKYESIPEPIWIY